jgi:hypothetical protein
MSHVADVEQLPYRLFLKMTDERSQPPHSQPSIIPAARAGSSLVATTGDELFGAREYRTRWLRGPK